MTTETAYTLPLRFFFCSFSVGPVASGNARDFFGTSQTFHVLPYLDGCTLRVNHFLRKLFTWCSKRAFLIRDQVKRWSGKSKCVLWNPSCYDLRLFRTGEHSSRESKQKRNTIRTSFLLEAAAVSRFFNQPAVRNYIASSLWLAEQNSREFLSQSKKNIKTSRDLLTRVVPRLRSATCLQVWLVHLIVSSCCDWPELLHWLSFTTLHFVHV